jgi:hypothetical protein
VRAIGERDCCMPGGYLSFGIYQALGGERTFGEFWATLGLPVVVLLASCYLLLVRHDIVSQRTWIIGSVGMIAVMTAAIGLRMIR